MSTLPLLPDLPPVSDEAGALPASSRNPLGFALPLLGAFALSRGGGGAEGLMEGLARGLQLGSIMRERQEATAERKTLIEEQRAERRAGLRREFLKHTSDLLARLDDPDEFDQAKGQLRGVAAEFGVRPEELDVYAFPASKRSKLKRARAGAVLNQLITSHGAGKVFGELLDTTVDVAGESLSVRQLLKLAEFPIPKREVTRPVIEERPAPDVTGTGPGLALAGLPQRIQTGTETITEEILPQVSSRLTLAEYDPRFRTTPFARTKVPLDKDGEVDTAAIMRYYDEARKQGVPGFADPAGAAKDRFDQVMKERDDVRHRMDAIRTQMDQAKTEEQFRAGVQAWNRLVENVARGKGYLGFTQVPFDVPTAVGQWKADLAARRRKVGEGFTTEEGRPASGRYRLVRGVRGGQAILDTQTGIRLTVAQAQERARREGDAELARVLGITPPEAKDLTETVGGRTMTLAEIEDEMRITGISMRDLRKDLAVDPTGSKQHLLGQRLKHLSAARSRLLARRRRDQTPQRLPPPPPAQTTKVLSRALVQAEATERGISYEQAAADARRQGYTIR